MINLILIKIFDIYHIIIDLIFDWKYGIETCQNRELSEVEVTAPSVANGRRYQGTHCVIFNKVFDELNVDFKYGVFLDIGCGKGRAMLMAAEQKFNKVIGVDFSPVLCADCESNIEAFKQKRGDLDTDFEVVHSDILDYEIPEDLDLIFFFNPFDGQILDLLLKKLKKIAISSGGFFVVYVNPIREYLFDIHGINLYYRFDNIDHNNIVNVYKM